MRSGSRLLRAAIVVALLLHASAVVAVQEPPQEAATREPWQELSALLGAGDFAAAIARIEVWPEARRTASAALLARLRLAASTLATADEYLASRRFQRATSIVEDLRGSLGGDENLLLRAGLDQKLRAIDQKASAAEEALTKEILAGARALADKEQFVEAIALYDQVLVRPQPLLSEPTLAEARRGKLDVEVARAQAAEFWPKTWLVLRDGVRTLGIWVLLLLGAVLGVSLWQRALRLLGTRKVTAIEGEDLSATASDRRAFGWSLTQQLKQRLETNRQPKGDLAVIDPGEDFDRSGLANVQLDTAPLGGLEELTSVSDPVRLGPFTATPRQVATLLGSAFRRPCDRKVVAVLAAQAGSWELTLTLEHAGHKTSASFTAAQRAEVLDEAADYLAFQLAAWRLTSSWVSYRNVRCAERLLMNDGPTTKETLCLALELLQQSLGQDSRNWTAQFHLAIVLRKLGRNAEAAELLRALEEDLGAPPQDGRARFLGENPTFPFIVRYSLAVTLSKIDGWEERREAKALFQSIGNEVRAAGEKCSGEKDLPAARRWARLEMLAKAGLAAVLTGEMEALRFTHARTRAELRQHLGEIAHEIAQLKSELQTSMPVHRTRDPLAHGIALAVALNAHGRASFLTDDLDEAEEALVAARARNPRLACALINLAQVYEKQLKRRPECFEAMEELLGEAIRLSPDNRKAHHLLGKLYTFGGRLDFDRAREHYLKAGRNPSTDLVHAQLLATREAASAVLLLSSSLRRFQKPVDYRLQLFLELLLRMPAQDLSPALLEQARLVMRRIDDDPDAFSERERSKATTQLAQLEQRAKGAAAPAGPSKPLPASPSG